jgi:hypothetical protein
MESSAHGAAASGEPPQGATHEPPGGSGTSPAAAHAAGGDDVFAERPELFVGAAFAGGLVLAQILKRVRR